MMRVIEWHLHNNCIAWRLLTAWHLTSAWWLQYIKTTQWLTKWLPDVYLPKISLKLSDICPMTSRQLFDDCLTTAWCLPYDFWLPLDDSLRTPWRLPDNWLTNNLRTSSSLISQKHLTKTKTRRFKACVAARSYKQPKNKLYALKDNLQTLTTSHNSKLTGYISTYKLGIIILP